MARPIDPALLAALSTELTALASPVEDLGGLIAAHASGVTAADPNDVLRRGQAVDEVSQTLRALGDLLNALAHGEPAEAALNRLSLSAVAARLAGENAPAVGAGDFQLFD